MKQYITAKQWVELSRDSRKKLFAWYESKDYPELIDGIFLFSIGQMIEFLGDDLIYIQQWRVPLKEFWNVTTSGGCYEAKELTDALWSAVKEILKTHENKD